MTERVLIGSDHAGYDLKERLKAELDYAKRVASEVANGSVARGVLMCGTGLGMSYTANRFPGVRAALAWTPEIAELSRRHNDANILVLPARFIEPAQGIEILRRWLEAPFDGGRHERRVAKIEGDT